MLYYYISLRKHEKGEEKKRKIEEREWDWESQRDAHEWTKIILINLANSNGDCVEEGEEKKYEIN